MQLCLLESKTLLFLWKKKKKRVFELCVFVLLSITDISDISCILLKAGKQANTFSASKRSKIRKDNHFPCWKEVCSNLQGNILCYVFYNLLFLTQREERAKRCANSLEFGQVFLSWTEENKVLLVTWAVFALWTSFLLYTCPHSEWKHWRLDWKYSEMLVETQTLKRNCIKYKWLTVFLTWHIQAREVRKLLFLPILHIWATQNHFYLHPRPRGSRCLLYVHACFWSGGVCLLFGGMSWRVRSPHYQF